MEVLLGLVLGIGAFLAVLYYWLQAHWFARVVVFLLLALTLGVAGGAATASPQAPALAFVGMVPGVALAWALAGIPRYYWRHRMRGLAG